MKKNTRVFIGMLLGAALVLLMAPSCPAQESQSEVSVCEQAGGEIARVEECDGSMSEWCVISEKEQCYADQVQNGKCTVGHYDEEMQGIVGITPRVLCQEKKGNDG